MLQYHIAVCDDEIFAAQAVADAAAHCLERNGAHAEVEVFNSARDLALSMDKTDYDLVLLDIEMPQIDGIQLGRALRAGSDTAKTEIIYVSNNESRVFEALPVRPLAFVRKSRFNEDMQAAMTAFVKQSRRSAGDSMVTLKLHGSMATFPAAKIAYVEARRRDKIVHLADGRTEEVQTTLEEMEEKLKGLGFCRVHKGFLVNLAQVERIGAGELYVDGEAIPIGRSKSEAVRLAYMNYLSEKNAVVL